ncbi:unnamed protein product [Colias eurytheme]|nr:unnamed protein product [Colias eurytheme]
MGCGRTTRGSGTNDIDDMAGDGMPTIVGDMYTMPGDMAIRAGDDICDDIAGEDLGIRVTTSAPLLVMTWTRGLVTTSVPWPVKTWPPQRATASSPWTSP